MSYPMRYGSLSSSSSDSSLGVLDSTTSLLERMSLYDQSTSSCSSGNTSSLLWGRSAPDDLSFSTADQWIRHDPCSSPPLQSTPVVKRQHTTHESTRKLQDRAQVGRINLGTSWPSTQDNDPHPQIMENPITRRKTSYVGRSSPSNHPQPRRSNSSRTRKPNQTKTTDAKKTDQVLENHRKVRGGGGMTWDTWFVKKAVQAYQCKSVAVAGSPLQHANGKVQTPHKTTTHKQETASLRFKAWVEQKDNQYRLAKKFEEVQSEIRKEQEELKRAKRWTAAKNSFTEWLHRKETQKLARLEQDKQSQQSNTDTMEHRKKVCKLEFDAWRKRSSCRPAALKLSLALDRGIVKPFYDAGAVPQPDIVQTRPWSPCTGS